MSRKLPCLFLIAFAWAIPSAWASGNFVARQEVLSFIQDMQDKHGFDRASLLRLFRKAQPQPRAIRAIMPPKDPAVRSWQSYRARFIEPVRIERGLRFWEAHGSTLEAARRIYGVPEEVIVAIIGIEFDFDFGFGVISGLGNEADSKAIFD